jgi:hypothetical protein
MHLTPILLGSALLLTGCGTDPNTFHVGCDQIEAVQISGGLTPAFDWTPDCRVASIGVYEGIPAVPGDDPTPPLPGEAPSGATRGELMWQVNAPASAGNLLSPTVHYGSAPGGAVEQAPATPLTTGQLYLFVLSVERSDGSQPSARWTTEFRP